MNNATDAESISSPKEDEIKQEFQDITKGTLNAASTDPESLIFADDTSFSWKEFEETEPEYCGQTEDGEDQGSYRTILENSSSFTSDEYQAKVDAVWQYWESLGLEPSNFSPAENARSIRADTKTGGEVTYMASKYGEYITFDSVCSERVTVPDDGS